MPLSCECAWGERGSIYYESPEPTTYERKRRTRCKSCNLLIDPGDEVARFKCNKIPGTEIEERIYGEDGVIQRADHYVCETCADILFNLHAQGFECILPYEVLSCFKDFLALTEDTHKSFSESRRAEEHKSIRA